MRGDAALFHAPTKERWAGGRSLVPLTPGVCPVDGLPLAEMTTGEPMLFRHGGHGATRTSVTSWCPGCGWQLVREISELRPV